MNLMQNYLENVVFEFDRHKKWAESTFAQLTDEEIHWSFSESDNSIAIIVKHMVGNMLSRWTNFLTEDGEKAWRDRENEFEDTYSSKDQMLKAWNQGWNCLFQALESIKPENFDTVIKIRNEDHTIIEAVNRQLTHYAGHVGQIILLGKMIKGKDWLSPTIPKGGSEAFNKQKFGK